MPFQYFYNHNQSAPKAFLENLRRFDDIRPYCAKSLRAGVEPVRSITVPGGLYHADTVDYPCAPMVNQEFGKHGHEPHTDTRRVLRFVQYMVRSGIPVDPNFTVRYSNFLNGEDFLATDYKSDAVLISFILNEKPTAHPEEPQLFDAENAAQKWTISSFQSALAAGQFDRAAWIAKSGMGTFVSPHAKPERWRERLSSTKVLASIHRADEIHLDRLGLENHTIVLNGLPVARKRLGADIEGVDSPRDQWELAFERGYEASLRPHFSQNTLLGQALAGPPPMAQQEPPARPLLMPRLFSRFRAARP